MEQLNLIIDTYQRIILESESKLAKVKQHIYRIGTLRLILFAAGIAGILFLGRGQAGDRRYRGYHLHPLHIIGETAQPVVSSERLP